jgi:cytochrome c biogenesis protein CcmG/thiol:disulfide interchange protein DsbE
MERPPLADVDTVPAGADTAPNDGGGSGGTSGVPVRSPDGSEGGPPPRHTARWVAIGVLVVAAGLIAVLATRPPAAVTEVYSPLVGKLAPPVTGITTDGSRYVLPRAPGRYIVLNFFASWCEPCQTEGPDLVQFEYQHQQAGDASVVSVIFDDSVSAARSYQATLGAEWPTLADPGGLALSYGVRAPPSTFIIAPSGRVVAFIESPVTAAGLDQIIAAARASHP